MGPRIFREPPHHNLVNLLIHSEVIVVQQNLFAFRQPDLLIESPMALIIRRGLEIIKLCPAVKKLRKAAPLL